jgi:L-fuculose-phosphate aldolase
MKPATVALPRQDPPGHLAARQHLLDAAQALARERLVIGMTGNVSVRIGNVVLITPTRIPYARMGVEDMVSVSLEGERFAGRHPPSRELPLHLAVYRRRPRFAALVHTHSPYATAWSFLGEPLHPQTEDNEYYGIGPVLTAPPSPSGSSQLAAAAADLMSDSAAVLLGRHGLLAAAEGLDQALDVARVVEHQAQVAWILRSHRVGPPQRS